MLVIQTGKFGPCIYHVAETLFLSTICSTLIHHRTLYIIQSSYVFKKNVNRKVTPFPTHTNSYKVTTICPALMRRAITRNFLNFQHNLEFVEGLFLWVKFSGKIFSRKHIEVFFLIFARKQIWHLVQIVSNGDNLYEMSNSVHWKKIIKIQSNLSHSKCKGLQEVLRIIGSSNFRNR